MNKWALEIIELNMKYINKYRRMLYKHIDAKFDVSSYYRRVNPEGNGSNIADSNPEKEYTYTSIRLLLPVA